MSLRAQDSTPTEAMQSAASEPWQDIDLASALDATPQEAPVSEPLTGKEKAGVNLTWGIICILIGFLLVILGIFIWGEYQFFMSMQEVKLASFDADKTVNLFSEIAQQRSEFRAFWFDTLQLILLNVLFPTLTALLGYVFGTSRNVS
ncbi:hypothetical protein [Pseudoalteromonas luteoviolacea]|uniref:Uncharacterized protein n=1 Tax=Pseudoalteromonas luteoviolacea DSM 6061 TaxID=1365250 RepID=A0A166VUU9_9GAMM|nr:hypothetical protein [Pseudoalteromonas luteoviolacea]KZN33811.1 hypothetical protein N475_19770 [Pseudoalteromonas luteoviolacea DSM 6061]KZN55053.1 hypothetical protein N474_16410 [Pseudoalteromonas luteoviolacea CPMOR-2]MBE0389248.1 hypothetical protein [Pseudoalteromonas luteoviolacea DSM 6061]TQF68033.1 hypothetical protein FLM44_22965 [Pseudoalteromonas luteoviolacea]